ncbi:AraC family transcriptional regulator [Marinovum sp. SP66]|uniref:AraC family transcriptional regulator n=1 Tax=Marinovum TaxID=367771 RepID=UPI00237AB5EB|nr:AraC family transcriptional regulator [Marinovum sp. SP66]MDD9739493.1 AraC family transcriptional regulator [Marinovum sp. SP66]
MDRENLFRRLRVEVETYGFCEAHSGWRLRFEASEAASLHMCLSGRGRMRLSSGVGLPMRPGALVLLPADTEYGFEAGPEIVSECDAERAFPDNDESLKLYRAGDGDEDPLVVACGEIILANDEIADFLTWLDEPVIEEVPELIPSSHGLLTLFFELRDGREVSVAFLETLLKGLLIRALDIHPDLGGSVLVNLLDAADRRLARALELIVTHPSDAITIEMLTANAGMSRTLLFEHFKEAFGMSPMRFIYDLRLTRAAQMLSGGPGSVGEIARATGFRSRSHFNREFKRKYGQTPGRFRG